MKETEAVCLDHEGSSAMTYDWTNVPWHAELKSCLARSPTTAFRRIPLPPCHEQEEDKRDAGARVQRPLW